MLINGLQKLSLSDYDKKISCVIFTPGCNFRCHFCHNSSLVNKFENNPIIPEDDVFAFLKNKVGKIDAVVISGGEPTLQKDLKEFIAKVKQLGYLVKLDTNGTNPEILKDLVKEKLLDYVAMDIKSDWENLDKITNTKSEEYKNKIQESISFLLSDKVDYEFRTTLVKEIHNETCIKNISSIIKNAKKYVLQKYIESENVLNKIFSEVPKKDAEKFLEILKPNIQNIETRNY